jgi:ricin-type beta-trefoil lectin protein
VALYDEGSATARLITIANQGGTWTSGAWWSSGAGTFDATRATLSLGDFDGDGRADAAALYDLGGGVRRLYGFTSTGTAFADKQTRWEGYVSDALPAVDVDASRKYRIQPVFSNKCFDVPGGSTANGTAIDQYDCVATAGWEQFQFAEVGAAPHYYLRTNAGKCVDDKGWSTLDNAPAIQRACDTSGLPQPNEQFRLDYASGSGQDTVVTIRNVHSDKCLTVSGGEHGQQRGDRTDDLRPHATNQPAVPPARRCLIR